MAPRRGTARLDEIATGARPVMSSSERTSGTPTNIRPTHIVSMLRVPLNFSSFVVYLCCDIFAGTDASSPKLPIDLTPPRTSPTHSGFQESTRWFRQAAEGGCVDAAFHLGFSYLAGLGVPLDQNRARRWFRVAASAGHPEATGTLQARHQTLNPRVPKP